MSETSIQSLPNPAPLLPSIPPRPRRDSWRWPRKALRALASLRLTVFLFALSMILVFCGTLAMMDQGLFTVLTRYFRSGIVWIPFQTFVRFGQVFFGLSPHTVLSASFPFPGGWTIGALLLINLLAAHAVRFRFTWKRSGILILHSGLIVLMLGELATGLFAVESNMTIYVGGSANFIENFDRVELAFEWPSDARNDHVVVVPGRLLKQGAILHHEDLPVDIEVKRYIPNSTLTDNPPPPEEYSDLRGLGRQGGIAEQPPGRGVDSEQKRDMPSAYIILKDKNSGDPLGTYLVSLLLKAQDADIDGTTYRIALRLRRSYRPFSLHLKELRHENHHGTTLAKRYASLVHLTDSAHDEDRDVLIHMNHPFYYQGETFYQSGVNVDRSIGREYTVLQVVHNPGWLLPYIACTMIIVGLIVHFILHLLDFFRRKVMA